jgi:DNA-binding XRE family transcriptional regulator
MRPADLAAAALVRGDLRSGAARGRRIAAGVSGADVARAMRPPVSPQAVFSWETGRTRPTAEHALAYGRVLAALTRRAA